MINHHTPPSLQPPGMGLPKYELIIARILVAIKLRTTSAARAHEIFAHESREILALAAATDPARAKEQVLIDRLRGLEDSSRYWSLYMTMQHLCIVNRLTIDVIKALLEGKSPNTKASTAAVKPSPGADEAVIQNFRAISEEFLSLCSPPLNLHTKATYSHPWFGPLTARQWHFFAGFHMQLHRKQMGKILEVISE